MDDTIRLILGCITGGIIGVLIVYGQHVALTNISNEIKKVSNRQDEVEFRTAELGESFLKFLEEFKALLLAEQERHRQEQTDTKDKDNG